MYEGNAHQTTLTITRIKDKNVTTSSLIYREEDHSKINTE